MELPKELNYSVIKPEALTTPEKVIYDDFKFTTNSASDKFSYSGSKQFDIEISGEGLADAQEHYLIFKVKSLCGTAGDNFYIDGSGHSIFRKIWLSSGTDSNISAIDNYHIFAQEISRLQGKDYKASVLGKIAGYYELTQGSGLTLEPTITQTGDGIYRYYRINLLHPFFHTDKYLPIGELNDTWIHFELNPPALVMKSAHTDTAITAPSYEVSDVALYMPRVRFTSSEEMSKIKATKLAGQLIFGGTTGIVITRTMTSGDNQTLEFKMDHKKSVKSLLTVFKRSQYSENTMYRYITRNICPDNLISYKYIIDGRERLEMSTLAFSGSSGFAHPITQLARVCGVSSSLSNLLPEITEASYLYKTPIAIDTTAHQNTNTLGSFSLPLDLDVYNGATDLGKLGIPVDGVKIELKNNGTSLKCETEEISTRNLTVYLIALCDVRFMIAPDGYLKCSM